MQPHEVKHELMWRVATVRVPKLIASLEPLAPPDRPEMEA